MPRISTCQHRNKNGKCCGRIGSIYVYMFRCFFLQVIVPVHVHISSDCIEQNLKCISRHFKSSWIKIIRDAYKVMFNIVRTVPEMNDRRDARLFPWIFFLDLFDFLHIFTIFCKVVKMLNVQSNIKRKHVQLNLHLFLCRFFFKSSCSS